MRQAKAKMQRMIVQILWTLGVFCGTPDKTRPEKKIETGKEGKKRSSALSASIRENPRRRMVVPKKNAARASHPDRIRTCFPACLVTAWRRPLAEERPLGPDSARALSNDECRICQSQLPFAITQSLVAQSLVAQSMINRSYDLTIRISRSRTSTAAVAS
jgi:hypothetical protein